MQSARAHKVGTAAAAFVSAPPRSETDRIWFIPAASREVAGHRSHWKKLR
jgi:hypothetical protein